MHPLLRPPNARFWNYWNGTFVKLTVRPGVPLTLHRHSQDEEGWSSEAETFRHEGDRVLCLWGTDGRDCDGRLQRSGSSACSLDQLRSHPITESWHLDELRPWHTDERGRWILRPLWCPNSSPCQRDQYAEAAGY